MLLTLYYMAATWMQAWRLSSVLSVTYKLFVCGAGCDHVADTVLRGCHMDASLET